MNDPVEPLGMTGHEIGAIRAELEREGPCLVGQILFAFGRLEFNLVLHLASFGDPAAYEVRRVQIEADNFAFKLDRLRKLAREPQLSSAARYAYEGWCDQADDMRRLRNRLAHGRWGFDHMERTVVNVARRSTESEDNVVAFTLDGLRAQLGAVGRLEGALWELRQHWKLVDVRLLGDHRVS